MNRNISILLIISSLCCLSKIKAQERKDSISTMEIQEVLIKSQRKKQFSDHANYTFDKEALEKARYSKDLLTTLPELQLDPVSNTETNIKGGIQAKEKFAYRLGTGLTNIFNKSVIGSKVVGLL